jgi:hypothetical protein
MVEFWLEFVGKVLLQFDPKGIILENFVVLVQ